MIAPQPALVFTIVARKGSETVRIRRETFDAAFDATAKLRSLGYSIASLKRTREVAQ